MPIEFGPILKLWNSSSNSWTVSVLIGQTAGTAPALDYKVSGDSRPSVKMEKLATRGGLKYFRGLMELTLAESDQEVKYSIAGKSHTFRIPKAGGLPSVAYTSCNGFHTGSIPSDLEGKVPAMWEVIKREHGKNNRYHLLLMGGD